MEEYFVVGVQPIVAQDLAAAILAHDPQAQVVIFRTGQEVVTALSRARPKAVVLQGGLAGFDMADLGQALAHDAIPFGFLSAMEDTLHGAAVLVSPFTEATVGAFLTELLAKQPETDDTP